MKDRTQYTYSSSTKRIAKNTLMLYFRQILIMLVSLYTVRVVLATLGEEDYGIYNVVAGVVTMFSFLSGSMASATQRFFSYALGEGSEEKLKTIFSVNLLVYIGIALIAVILLETIGMWFVHDKLNVPQNRLDSVVLLFHLSVFSFVCTIFSSPFMAIIIAHEDMQLYAYISIVDTALKLCLVFVLGVISYDRLVSYGALLAIVSGINTIIYVIVCVRMYVECQFRRFHWNKGLFREICSFTGWSLFGQLTTVGRAQAVTVLINQMFSPLVVASRSVASQVTGAVNVFATNFNTGMYPAIIKNYASNNKDEMFSLLFRGCKLCFFLIWIFALPLFVEMEYVLNLWLVNSPDGVVLFTRLAIIEVVINAICLPLGTAARAPGKMRKYELSLGSIQVGIFVTDLILFRFFSASAHIVYVVAAVGNLVMMLVRLVLIKESLCFPVKKFVVQVLGRLFIVGCVSGCVAWFVGELMSNDFFGIVCSVLVIIAFSILAMGMMGLSSQERVFIVSKIKGRFGKV